MPAVTERWIGGTLTNFSTVRERLTRLVELEGLEATDRYIYRGQLRARPGFPCVPVEAAPEPTSMPQWL